MDERGARFARARRVLLSGALGLLVMGAAPWSAAAADASPSPDATASPTLDPTPEPTAVPTAQPTVEPAGQATAAPSPTAPPPTPTPTATPDPTPTANPSPTPTQPPSPTATIKSRNLYRWSAMVRQYTNYWCVPAATQSMVNLVRGTSDRYYATQKLYYTFTRRHNRYTYATRGNDPQGWAWAATYFSKGQATYRARAFSDKTAAVNAIAEAIERTGDPVGVTVRAGTHAWVVLGYRMSVSTTDPSKKTLLGLYVSGPLGTTADRWPYKYLTVSQFREYFTRYHEWQRSVIWEGKWVVISQ
jgi:hypothetical protein